MILSRRRILASCLAAPMLAAFRAFGQVSDPFAPALDRARSLEQLHSLIIGQRGEVRLAEAVRGPALARVVNVKSASKTIVAALVGCAIDRGVVSGVEATLGSLTPDLIPPDADARVKTLTIANLLAMQSGLERTSGENYGGWVASRNWVADALRRPMPDAPGQGWQYSTGNYHVLGAVLSEVTGESLLALARDWLGGPLGIEVAPWTRDPQGRYLGGNNMGLTPMGLFRFGEAFRAGGRWQTTSVISAAWIDASWQARARSIYSGDLYGYGWFLTSLRGHRVAYARGYGGQMLYVVPDLDLTVVVISDPNRPARSDGHVGELRRMLVETILPAAERAA